MLKTVGTLMLLGYTASLYVEAFQALPFTTCRSHARIAMSICGDHQETRKSFFEKSLSLLGGLGITGGLLEGVSNPEPTPAAVYLETERYGDKELKIATVNKLKQQLRNKMVKDPALAPSFLKVAISDALGYDVKAQTGGPDGSVAFEMDRPENKDLKQVLEATMSIKASLQRTNEISLADVIAFGGAEAIEAVGGPRLSVQIGRYDEKRIPNPAPVIDGYSFVDPSGPGLKAAFKRSGLGGREMALLLGALGSVTDIVDGVLGNEGGGGEDDDLVDNSWQDAVPSTFGKQSDMYGKGIGKGFGSGYLARISRKGGAGGRGLGSALMEDEEARNYVEKYASNEKAFLADLGEAYSKLTLLGERYESRKD